MTKGGSGTVYIPLQPDDPLYRPGSPTNFMVLTRATNQPGHDGILGTADDVHEHTNTTTPFVDQNQTYTSHPSHQVFLREYVLDGAGKPVATGRLIENRDAGDDGVYFTGDDVETGGLATWAVVKAQAAMLLGIELTRRRRHQRAAARDRRLRQLPAGCQRLPAAGDVGQLAGRGQPRTPR